MSIGSQSRAGSGRDQGHGGAEGDWDLYRVPGRGGMWYMDGKNGPDSHPPLRPLQCDFAASLLKSGVYFPSPGPRAGFVTCSDNRLGRKGRCANPVLRPHGLFHAFAANHPGIGLEDGRPCATIPAAPDPAKAPGSGDSPAW